MANGENLKIGAGALTGAGTGAVAGPIGAVIGAAIGAGAALLGIKAEGKLPPPPAAWYLAAWVPVAGVALLTAGAVGLLLWRRRG